MVTDLVIRIETELLKGAGIDEYAATIYRFGQAVADMRMP